MSVREAIETGRISWQAEHGKCAMCDVGDRPYHGLHREQFKCGNSESCLACHNALPPGEICQACFRKNVHEFET